MNKVIYAFCIFLMTSASCYAQTYYYDYLKHTIYSDPAHSKPVKPKLYVKHGDCIYIEIFNYNPLNTQISIADSSSQFFLSDTSKFSKLIVIPAIGDITNKTLGEAGNGKKDTTSAKCKDIAALMEKFDNVKRMVVNSMTGYKEYIAKVEIIKAISSKFSNVNKRSVTTTEILKELSGYLATLNNFLSNKNKTDNTFDSNVNNVNRANFNAVEEAFYQDVQKAGAASQALLAELNKLPSKSKADCIDQFTTLTTALTTLTSNIQDFQKDYTDKVYPGFQTTVSVFENMQPYAIELPTFPSKSICIDNDETIVKIYGTQNGVSTLKDNIYIQPNKGWKLDIAGGFFVSGLSDDIFSRNTKDSIYSSKYLVNGVSRDTLLNKTFTSISKQKQENVSFGGMVYLHAHTLNYDQLFNFGISLGFGALFNDQARWVGSLGPTILIGKKQRFNINPSVILSHVDRLSAPYQTGVWYSETINNVPTYKAWKFGWAVGFSWNLNTK